MKINKTKISIGNTLEAPIRKATSLHGHLGPFLIIGVRMGKLANKELDTSTDGLRATAKLPLLTPYSCILDGIQITTQCTVGNRKLQIENSPEEISVHFEQLDSSKELLVHVNSEIVGELENSFSRGVSNEELAQEMASILENRLFLIEKSP